MRHLLVLLVVLCFFSGGNAQSGVNNTACGVGAPFKSSMVGSTVASFSCGMSEAAIASTGATRVYGGPNRSNRVYIGRNSLSTTSDPIVAFFKAGKQVWCRTDYETSVDHVDGHGLIFYSNGEQDELFAVFNSRGYLQGSGGADFRRFAQHGRESTYGPLAAGNCGSRNPQGASKASIVSKLDLASGSVLTSTYLTGERLFGTTSEFRVTKLDHVPATRSQSARLVVNALTAGAPLRTDLTRMICNQGGPYTYTVELSSDLSSALKASAVGCY
eukprot:TRINITY_DN2315_c0_g1_i1.p1 TRINITY_DN2315_c0_g1~~TRINITY_DN2315_c0_g1_i1.p1  ORF type:complete len:273 (+),score=34.30 TRINITY_DN2315_c0_g1_i1:75-893(+)